MDRMDVIRAVLRGSVQLIANVVQLQQDRQ
jgi:hypothetical protein